MMKDVVKGEDMRIFTICLILLTILTACAPTAPAQENSTPEPVGAATARPDGAVESHTVAIDGTFQTSLLAVEWKSKSKGSVLFPVDPVSGLAVPGYTPTSLGLTSFHAFSPDRSKLALVSFPTETSSNGSLVLVDLPTWTSQHFELKLRGWVSNLVFSPDGKQLAIAHGESSYTLTIVNVQEGVITAQSKTDSIVTRLNFTKSGEALMLYGPAIHTTDGLSAAPPQVSLLNAADLRLLWSTELDNVRDGVFPKDENVTEATLHEPGQAFYISPGLVFAPDRDVLYVVHADSEQLTTVDFDAQQSNTVEIEAKLTWFERFLSLTASIAHAKIGDGITRQAAVSPDGKFLYVVGVNNSTSVDQQGNWQMEQTPLGLEIIQASDGSRVEHIDSDATELSLSPDGHFLYLRTWGNNQDNIPTTEIFDAAEQQLITRKTGISATPALLVNGQFLLTSTYSTSETTHHMSILQPDGSDVLAEWTASEFIWWLAP
jgi:DNA-binding beta-propeller fold protein YncE